MGADVITTAFTRSFRRAPDVVVRSPGRVNLIGEHTDYNDGFALPGALDLGTDVAIRRRRGDVVRVVAAQLGERDKVAVAHLLTAGGPPWTRYVRGTIALARAAGCAIGGCDVLIDGDLPVGGGLSSSASVTVGVALAVQSVTDGPLDLPAMARLGQRVENEVVGVASGIMDQLAIALSVAGHALLVDCRSLDVEPVPMPPDGRLLVLDSGVSRNLAGSAYNRRRAECAAALHTLQQSSPGLRALRDATPDMLVGLHDVELRRARHVVTEDQRVLDAADALRRGDMAGVGALMAASHASLRDDYAVSCAELDTLVAIATATPGVFGARLTGAGFGGCAVALVQADAAAEAAARITAAYTLATGRKGRSWICTLADGARVVDAQEMR